MEDDARWLTYVIGCEGCQKKYAVRPGVMYYCQYCGWSFELKPVAGKLVLSAWDIDFEHCVVSSILWPVTERPTVLRE